MKRSRRLRADEIQAVLHSLRNEPPGPAIRNLAPGATWWEVQLRNPEELGSLRTLWHKKSCELIKSRDARAPTVSQICSTDSEWHLPTAWTSGESDTLRQSGDVNAG